MHIIAMSSGVLGQTPENERLKDYILALIDTPRPRVAYLPTPAGDAVESIVSFYETFPADRYQPSHLLLFKRTVEDLRSFVLRQQVIYVAGGNTANALAIWRLHGLDAILREAWEQGIVLCGASAGGLCWFDSGVTDSFGLSLAPITNGLGFLSGSFCPHYNSEVRRRPVFQRCVGQGLAAGWACDDGAALHFVGRELQEAVSSVPSARVYWVERRDGEVHETAVEPRRL